MDEVYEHNGMIIELGLDLRKARLDRVFFYNINALKAQLQSAQAEMRQNAQNIRLL